MIHFKTIFKSILVLALIAVSLQALAVWVDPTDIAPKKNAESPINVGMTGQTKLGAFRAGGIRAETSIIAADGILGTPDIPNSSSVLELRSTAKGFLPPRMNKAQRDAIASPATGLLVYQTNDTPGFYFFNGTLWVPVGVGGGSGGGIVNDGTGSANYIAKFTSNNSLGSANMTDDGSLIQVGGTFKLGGKLILSTRAISVNSSNATNLELADGTYFQISPQGSTTIQGFAPAQGQQHVHGRIVYITNKSQTDTFILKHDSSACSPENRLHTVSGNDIELLPNNTVMMFYDGGYGRWVEFFRSE